MPAFTVKMMDLATKQFFEADKAMGLEIKEAKNKRKAFTCPAPTERKNVCWKWASEAQLAEFAAA
jgi:hypothetical protein